MNEPKPATKPSDSRGDVIRVRVLRFADPTDGAGLHVASSVTGAVEPQKTAYWTIEFHPRLRHHQITWHRINEPDQVLFVPESRVMSWDPIL